MEIIEEKQIENLVKNGVIVATQKVLIQEGEENQNVGEMTREAYGNWQSDRERLMQSEPDDVVSAVFAIWGDTPTVADPAPADEERDDE